MTSDVLKIYILPSMFTLAWDLLVLNFCIYGTYEYIFKLKNKGWDDLDFGLEFAKIFEIIGWLSWLKVIPCQLSQHGERLHLDRVIVGIETLYSKSLCGITWISNTVLCWTGRRLNRSMALYIYKAENCLLLVILTHGLKTKLTFKEYIKTLFNKGIFLTVKCWDIEDFR